MAYFTYWYLFPVAITIAVIAISAGISGTNFWIPVYLIWLGLDAKTGFWLALLTMIFGFGSGIIKNIRQKTINWYIVKEYLKITIPAGIIGSLLVPYAPSKLLLFAFSSFILAYGLFMLYKYYKSPTCTEKTDEVSHEKIYWMRAAIAGFLKGLIATGLGKLILPGILRHKKISSAAEAVGSTIFIIFIVNLAAVVFRLNPDFCSVLILQKTKIVQIMMWVAPGVVIGGQIGPAIASRLSKEAMQVYVGCLLVFVSMLIYLRAFALF